MKWNIIIYTILFILTLCSTSYSDSLEYVVTSVTTHPFVEPDVGERFANKIALNGRVNHTHMSGLVYVDESKYFYNSYKGFFGLNSIGLPMTGLAYSIGLRDWNSQLGVVLGGYIQDSNEFRKRDIDPGVGGDVMPVVGIEYNYKWYISKDEFIKLNNLFTPIITNHSIAIGVDF